MSNDTPEDRDLDDASITDQTARATGISSTYTVLGEFSDASGAGRDDEASLNWSVVAGGGRGALAPDGGHISLQRTHPRL